VRLLIFLSGLTLALTGIAAFGMTKDPALLQGGLTLGGGFIICAAFSVRARWHGIAGAGALALLGGLRALPAIGREPRIFHTTAALACGIVLIAVTRALLQERRRRSIEKLKAE
jgi:hypothetical protein